MKLINTHMHTHKAWDRNNNKMDVYAGTTTQSIEVMLLLLPVQKECLLNARGQYHVYQLLRQQRGGGERETKYLKSSHEISAAATNSHNRVWENGHQAKTHLWSLIQQVKQHLLQLIKVNTLNLRAKTTVVTPTLSRMITHIFSCWQDTNKQTQRHLVILSRYLLCGSLFVYI